MASVRRSDALLILVDLSREKGDISFTMSAVSLLCIYRKLTRVAKANSSPVLVSNKDVTFLLIVLILNNWNSYLIGQKQEGFCNLLEISLPNMF
jgi:hypothetical protein